MPLGLSFSLNSEPSLSSFTPPPVPNKSQIVISADQVNKEQRNAVERKQLTSESFSVLGNTNFAGVEKETPQEYAEEDKGHSRVSHGRLRPFILVGLALLILGWWISSTVLPATRHRWCVF